MKSGYVVSTGATTGVHDIRIGQESRIVFEGCGELLCRASKLGVDLLTLPLEEGDLPADG